MRFLRTLYQVLDAQGDYGIRDNGPIVTKWDQLQLAPELLRSLNKFGYVNDLECFPAS